MLYYWIHIAYIFIISKCFSKKVLPNETITRKRLVNIFDCEGFQYMSNNRYISYMDFSRFEILFRSNLYNATIKTGMTPILASQKIIYVKPLKLWDHFTITLINEGWNEKWVFHKQIFKKGKDIYAIGYTKVGFWKNKKVQNMIEIISKCGVKPTNKTPSQEILQLFINDSNLIKKQHEAK